MEKVTHSLTEKLDKRARNDILWTFGIIGVLLVFTWDIDFVEWLFEFTRAHEDWELDEIVSRILLIGFGCIWYAFRRHYDMLTSSKEIKKLAFFDPLTALPNRELVIDNLQQYIDKNASNNKQLAVFFIDIDNFKLINDNYGHNIGDEIIQVIADRLAKQLRPEDMLARLSGDEFLVIIDDLDDDKYAVYVSKRILDRMKEPIIIESSEIVMSVSIGISRYPNDSKDKKELLRQADIAMYHAKKVGKNCIRSYSENMDEALTARLNLEKKLRDAIAYDGFTLLYQPQVQSETGKIRAVEALVRLKEGNTGPAEFIPIAEETGLILQLGDWVLYEACRQTAEWQRNGIESIKVAVNVSTRQLQQHNFVSKVQQVLKATGLEPELLELEITESALTTDAIAVADKIRKLNAIGVLFAIDDFGTGHSSLERLKQFNISKIKIDKGFIKNLEHDNDDAIISKAIIALAHNMDMVAVAEGVETKAQVDFLTEYHCNKFQGYYFAKPLTADEIEQLVDNKPELDYLIYANQYKVEYRPSLN